MERYQIWGFIYFYNGELEWEGYWNYHGTTNILAHVVAELVGLDLMDFASTRAFPTLGIHEDDYYWHREGGVALNAWYCRRFFPFSCPTHPPTQPRTHKHRKDEP